MAETFGIAPPTAKKYISMTKEDIDSLGRPADYKKRESPMNAWLNVIYKMMLDGCSNETIFFISNTSIIIKNPIKSLQNIFPYWKK